MLGSPVSILLVLVGLAVPIAAVPGILALVLAGLYSPIPPLGDIYWTNSTDFILVAIPLFILMGEILLRSDTPNACMARCRTGSAGCRAG